MLRTKQDEIQLKVIKTECCASTCVISRTREYNEMEFQEKFAIVQENPIYDTIPLIIIDKMGRKYSKDKTENLKYYVSTPFWMKFRLLLFWILWAVLIMAMIISFLIYFCFIPRMCHSINTHKNIHE